MEKSNGTIALFPIDHAELMEQIRQIIRTEIQQAQMQAKPQSYQVEGLTRPPILKAEQVCSLLTISRQTLHQWKREGLIKAYKVKSRLYFLTTDVEKLVNLDLSNE